MTARPLCRGVGDHRDRRDPMARAHSRVISLPRKVGHGKTEPAHSIAAGSTCNTYDFATPANLEPLRTVSTPLHA